MEKSKTTIIVAAIVAGVAIGASLFMFYPDMMFKGTSLDTESGSNQFSEPYMDESGETLGGAPQVPSP